MSENKSTIRTFIEIALAIVAVVGCIAAVLVVPEFRDWLGLDKPDKTPADISNKDIDSPTYTPVGMSTVIDTPQPAQALPTNTPTASNSTNDTTPLIQPPVMHIGNVTIEEFGSSPLSLSDNEIIIGIADRYQDSLDIYNPPFTIFVVYGPIETELSIYWGGWDIWENASEDHVENEIASKIDEVKGNHPDDYKTRGYRVIKCYSQVTDCEVITTIP